jgi:hypothetical protein
MPLRVFTEVKETGVNNWNREINDLKVRQNVT